MKATPAVKATPAGKATPAAKAKAPAAPAPWLALDTDARARVAAVLDGRASVDTLRTPTERHYLALRWNWDAGVAPLRQLIDHPACALATAQHVLWHSLPDELIGFYASREDAERGDGEGDVFDLQLAICARAAAGGFAHHGVGYDPTDADGADFTEDWDADAAKHPIPTVLFVAVDGPRADPAIRF